MRAEGPVDYDAVVLAGGRARRLDGTDKPAVEIDGVSLLDRVLAAVAGARAVVVVGPDRPVPDGVLTCREDPPGGGPVAAVAAALPLLSSDVVLLLAADLPWIAPAVPMLLGAVPADGAAELVDADGRANHLAAAWRREVLDSRLASLPDVDGASMRSLVAEVPLVAVPDSEGWGADCDTWDDVEQARRRPSG